MKGREFWTATELWPGSTVVCIAGGPSLTAEQVDYVRGRARVIAINDAYRLAPWADALYFCDDKWWRWHRTHLEKWGGLIVRLQSSEHDFGDRRIKVMRHIGQQAGLSARRDALHTGQNSGFQAINLAVHLGAKRILLLGYDMAPATVEGKQKMHWFGDHPVQTSPNAFRQMLPWFETLTEPLRARGVEVVNCTGGGRLQCFPRASIQEALPEMVAA